MTVKHSFLYFIVTIGKVLVQKFSRSVSFSNTYRKISAMYSANICSYLSRAVLRVGFMFLQRRRRLRYGRWWWDGLGGLFAHVLFIRHPRLSFEMFGSPVPAV